ncbi:hypothetical protein T484DRAFT_1948117 [Baffinella frigidus]|nr:hypothetical protein T484DRAFT_1948117 [Cryptophyta sp. CCMP2293]
MHKHKSFYQQPSYSCSWSPATDLAKLVAESRSHQIRIQMDPRGHLLSVLGVQAPRGKIGGSLRRDSVPMVSRAGSLGNLREPLERRGRAPMLEAGAPLDLPAPPTMVEDMLAPDPLVGVEGIPNAGKRKFLLRASTMRNTNREDGVPRSGSVEIVRPLANSPNDHNTSIGGRLVRGARGAQPRSGSFSSLSPLHRPTSVEESPRRIPRRWSNPARTPTAASLLSPHAGSESGSERGELPRASQIRISWLPSARAFTDEFFPERASAPALQRTV